VGKNKIEFKCHFVQSRAKMLSCFDIERLNGICIELLSLHWLIA